jgi:hypothetical protein
MPTDSETSENAETYIQKYPLCIFNTEAYPNNETPA